MIYNSDTSAEVIGYQYHFIFHICNFLCMINQFQLEKLVSFSQLLIYCQFLVCFLQNHSEFFFTDIVYSEIFAPFYFRPSASVVSDGANSNVSNDVKPNGD